jgi:hypothetical protein
VNCVGTKSTCLVATPGKKDLDVDWDKAQNHKMELTG